MGDWPEFFFVGSILLTIAAGLGWYQIKAEPPEPDPNDPDPEAEQQFYSNQSRRRFQVALLIGVVGLTMIACGFVDPKTNQVLWWSLVLGCVVLAFWIALLGMGDALATWSFRSRQLRALKSQREVVQAELDRIRRGSISPGETK